MPLQTHPMFTTAQKDSMPPETSQSNTIISMYGFFYEDPVEQIDDLSVNWNGIHE